MSRFDKVSLDVYTEGVSLNENIASNMSLDDLINDYANIKLPERATVGSAGYDFYAPFDITLEHNQTIIVPTGIRAILDDGLVLTLYPRSGLGFKHRLRLNNTVGIIDLDFCLSDNGGHILVKLSNESENKETVFIKKGQGFCQGIITQFFLVENDNTTKTRNGGFGSSDATNNNA